MPALIPSNAVEEIVRGKLTQEGFRLNLRRRNGEGGADIEAVKGHEHIAVEVIAFKSHAPTRSRDFYEAFFRAISRLGPGVTRTVIAMPARGGNGLQARASHYGLGWLRIGEAFPELEIWLVDGSTATVEVSKWGDWAERPNPAT